jgi:hypothetical protein
VLTEDNYFEYFAAVTKLMAGKDAATKNAVAIGNDLPRVVTTAWNQNALLFLGFQMDDWHFRVLFHSILKQQGSSRRQQRPNVAVQLDPDQASVVDPQRARIYLQEYFNIDYITIYWGTAEEFIKELWREWQRSEQERK